MLRRTSHCVGGGSEWSRDDVRFWIQREQCVFLPSSRTRILLLTLWSDLITNVSLIASEQ